MKLISVSITTFSIFILTFFYACKDIAFNNPLDPDASKPVLNIIRVIETPLSGEGDLTFDGEKFWKIDNLGNLTAIDRESGAVIRSFFTEAGTGVTFFRDGLYVCNGKGENILYSIEPLSGDILNRISTTGILPGFLTVFEDRLLIYDVRSEGIFQYDLETGNTVRLFDMSGIAVGGIEFYKGGLLVSDMNTDFIYRYSLNGDVIDAFTTSATGIGGLTVDTSDYIYLFTLEGKIYKVSLP
jgi:hypothetical protein